LGVVVRLASGTCEPYFHFELEAAIPIASANKKTSNPAISVRTLADMGADSKEVGVVAVEPAEPSTPMASTSSKPYEYTPKLNFKVAPITPVNAHAPLSLGLTWNQTMGRPQLSTTVTSFARAPRKELSTPRVVLPTFVDPATVKPQEMKPLPKFVADKPPLPPKPFHEFKMGAAPVLASRVPILGSTFVKPDLPPLGVDMPTPKAPEVVPAESPKEPILAPAPPAAAPVEENKNNEVPEPVEEKVKTPSPEKKTKSPSPKNEKKGKSPSPEKKAKSPSPEKGKEAL